MGEQQQRTWAKIVAQAWADADFKARLMANPRAVLQEAGVEVPAGMELRVVENAANTVHFVLPPPPAPSSPEDHEERTSALCISPPISCW